MKKYNVRPKKIVNKDVDRAVSMSIGGYAAGPYSSEVDEALCPSRLPSDMDEVGEVDPEFIRTEQERANEDSWLDREPTPEDLGV